MHLNVPFVPIRKKGKLPGTCLEASFTKEYGTVRTKKGSVNTNINFRTLYKFKIHQ